MFKRILWISLAALGVSETWGCDLCAIYNADAALGKSGSGFSLAISEQFIPYRTIQLDGEKLPSSILNRVYLDRSMMHIVPTWNFSPRLGVSVSLPIVHQHYRQFQLTGT